MAFRLSYYFITHFCLMPGLKYLGSSYGHRIIAGSALLCISRKVTLYSELSSNNCFTIGFFTSVPNFLDFLIPNFISTLISIYWFCSFENFTIMVNFPVTLFSKLTFCNALLIVSG